MREYFFFKLHVHLLSRVVNLALIKYLPPLIQFHLKIYVAFSMRSTRQFVEILNYFCSRELTVRKLFAEKYIAKLHFRAIVH